MKTRKLYSAPAMKVVAVETEQMMAGSLTETNNSKVNVVEGEWSDEAGAKRSTSLWDDEDE